MTVRELIDSLRSMPQDMDVVVLDGTDTLCVVDDVVEIDGFDPCGGGYDTRPGMTDKQKKSHKIVRLTTK
jgi:hypothetical protein